MAKSRRRQQVDPRQSDFLGLLGDPQAELLPAPTPPATEPCALAFDQRMRRLLNEAIKASPLDREQIAMGVGALAGRAVTKPMIDSWTGAGRPHRFPADLIPAFCAVLGNSILVQGLGEASGCGVIEGYELQLARMGQLCLFIARARDEQEKIMASLPLFRRGGP